jgi:hypothetical protein
MELCLFNADDTVAPRRCYLGSCKQLRLRYTPSSLPFVSRFSFPVKPVGEKHVGMPTIAWFLSTADAAGDFPENEDQFFSLIEIVTIR